MNQRFKARSRRREKGVAAVELALVTPMLIALTIGVAQVGWLVMNYAVAANAAMVGAQYLAGQRGNASPSTGTVLQVSDVVGQMGSSLQILRSVAGTPCSTDTDCASALTAGQGEAAAVSVTFNFAPLCDTTLPGLAMPATITATSIARVQ